MGGCISLVFLSTESLRKITSQGYTEKPVAQILIGLNNRNPESDIRG